MRHKIQSVFEFFSDIIYIKKSENTFFKHTNHTIPALATRLTSVAQFVSEPMGLRAGTQLLHRGKVPLQPSAPGLHTWPRPSAGWPSGHERSPRPSISHSQSESAAGDQRVDRVRRYAVVAFFCPFYVACASCFLALLHCNCNCFYSPALLIHRTFSCCISFLCLFLYCILFQISDSFLCMLDNPGKYPSNHLLRHYKGNIATKFAIPADSLSLFPCQTQHQTPFMHIPNTHLPKFRNANPYPAPPLPRSFHATPPPLRLSPATVHRTRDRP